MGGCRAPARGCPGLSACRNSSLSGVLQSPSKNIFMDQEPDPPSNASHSLFGERVKSFSDCSIGIGSDCSHRGMHFCALAGSSELGLEGHAEELLLLDKRLKLQATSGVREFSF